MLPSELTQFNYEENLKSKSSNQRKKNYYQNQKINFKEDEINFQNFFTDNIDLTEINPYSLEASIARIENLKFDDMKNDMLNFKTKNYLMKCFDDNITFTLDNIKILTSLKNSSNEKSDYILLNDLFPFLLDDIEDSDEESENINEKPKKKITLRIVNKENGKKEILIKFKVNRDELMKNFETNFIDKSEYKSTKKLYTNLLEKEKFSCIKKNDVQILIQVQSINKIIFSNNSEI